MDNHYGPAAQNDSDKDRCNVCDSVTRYDGEICTCCGRVWGYDGEGLVCPPQQPMSEESGE